MSDCSWLDDENPEGRVLRVRFNRLGPLKEDKGDGPPKVKWAVTSDDLIAHLKPHLEWREREGAKDDDLVFVSPRGKVIRDQRLSEVWTRRPRTSPARAWQGPDAAGRARSVRRHRHTFVSRQLAGNEREDRERRHRPRRRRRLMRKHYAHVTRKTLPASMRRGLGVMPAPILPLSPAVAG